MLLVLCSKRVFVCSNSRAQHKAQKKDNNNKTTKIKGNWSKSILFGWFSFSSSFPFSFLFVFFLFVFFFSLLLFFYLSLNFARVFFYHNFHSTFSFVWLQSAFHISLSMRQRAHLHISFWGSSFQWLNFFSLFFLSFLFYCRFFLFAENYSIYFSAKIEQLRKNRWIFICVNKCISWK